MSRQPHATRAAAPAGSPKEKPSKREPAEKRSWLIDAVRALFVSDVRVRRVDGKLTVELEDKPGPQAATPAATTPTMRAELKALLNGVPGSRSRLRFLAAVEHGLKVKDPAGLFLYDVELERLRAALRQLDALAPAKPAEPLAALRVRLIDAIESGAREQQRLDMIAPRTDLMRDNRIEVGEARATDFDRIQEQWTAGPPAN